MTLADDTRHVLRELAASKITLPLALALDIEALSRRVGA